MTPHERARQHGRDHAKRVLGERSDKASDVALIKRAMSEHDAQMHGGKHTKLKLATGGAAKIEGRDAGGRMDRAKHGKGKGGKGTKVNVIVAGGGDKQPVPVPVPVKPPMAPPPGAAAAPPPGAMPPRPMPPPGAPVAGMGGGPMPPGGMIRKSGGRTHKRA